MEQLRDEQKETMIGRWNTVFGTLTAEPRRQIIVALMEAPPERALSLPEAANPSYLLRDPERLTIELVNAHLPALADADLVRWEQSPLTVSRGPAFEEAAIVFEALHRCAEDIPPRLAEGCQRLEERRGEGR